MTRDTYAAKSQPPGQLTCHVGDLQGDLRAHFVYLRGEETLPSSFRGLLRAFLFSRFFPLRAKRTEGDRGINCSGAGMGQVGFMRFQARPDTAWDSGKDVLMLDYDIDCNPGFVHPIRDEMCRLEPGVYLGRMGWPTSSSTRLGLYFTSIGVRAMPEKHRTDPQPWYIPANALVSTVRAAGSERACSIRSSTGVRSPCMSRRPPSMRGASRRRTIPR